MSAPASDLGPRVRSISGFERLLVVFEVPPSTMGLFSKIFGGSTEEGTDSSSKDAAAAEQAGETAASKAPDAPQVAPSRAAAQSPPAKTPASRREPARAADASPATRRGIAKTDELFAPPDTAEPRVVVATTQASAPAVLPDANARSEAAARPPAETAPSRQAASRPIEVHAAPIKVAGNGPAPNAPKLGPTAGTATAKPSTRRESSRPAAKAAKPAPTRSAAPVRSSRAGKQPGPSDASSAAEPPSPGGTSATTPDGAKAVTLDLDSLPPPAPSAAALPPVEPEDELDRAFARVESGETAQPPLPGIHVVDPMTREHNATLFREMAIGFARPLRDFMLDLVLGPTTKQWLQIARAPVQNLLKGAVEFELTQLAAALAEFGQGLEDARNVLGAMVTGTDRERLLAQYESLVRALPAAFDLKGERSRREPMVVHHLLLQIPGVHQLAIDKLYAAGLASLEALGRSSVDDLMAHARLERDGAEGIVSRFRSYLQERTGQAVEKGESLVKQRLSALIEELGHAHQDFLRADADEDRPAKRRARVERRARALEMNVLLAQLGEIELIAELERSATDRRLERMRSYVESSGRAQPTPQEAS